MRLLDTNRLEIHEFSGSDIPPYAILSHTWGEGEVSFQEMQSGDAVSKVGYEKVKRCCKLAASEDFQYIWADTCCIDKSSSSELSEAINSMFLWYQDSGVCYAYLSDVPSTDLEADGESVRILPFRQSRWFTRGWTLQELLAPDELVFYAQDWTKIGPRSALETPIRDITGISLPGWRDACVAQKMSWASGRQTTRSEDAAYCLMGLFGVNMPLLYGERENAFLRLQNEIMRISDDESIFAWRDGRKTDGTGLLAESPAAFADSGNVRLPTYPTHDAAPYSMSNRGLRLEKYIFPRSDPSWPHAVDDTYFVPLNCESGNFAKCPIGLYLRRLDGSQFTRIMPSVLYELGMNQREELEQCWQTKEPRTILYVKQSHGSDNPLHGPYTVRIDLESLVCGGFDILQREMPPRFQWSEDEAYSVWGGEKLVSSSLSIFDSSPATLLFSNQSGTESFLLSLYGRKNELACRISTPTGGNLRSLQRPDDLDFAMAEEGISKADIRIGQLQKGTVVCVCKKRQVDTAATDFGLKVWLLREMGLGVVRRRLGSPK